MRIRKGLNVHSSENKWEILQMGIHFFSESERMIRSCRDVFRSRESESSLAQNSLPGFPSLRSRTFAKVAFFFGTQRDSAPSLSLRSILSERRRVGRLM